MERRLVVPLIVAILVSFAFYLVSVDIVEAGGTACVSYYNIVARGCGNRLYGPCYFGLCADCGLMGCRDRSGCGDEWMTYEFQYDDYQGNILWGVYCSCDQSCGSECDSDFDCSGVGQKCDVGTCAEEATCVCYCDPDKCAAEMTCGGGVIPKCRPDGTCGCAACLTSADCNPNDPFVPRYCCVDAPDGPQPGTGTCVPKGIWGNDKKWLCDPPDWEYEESAVIEEPVVTENIEKEPTMFEIIWNFIQSLFKN